jgi:hypothetical protein
MGAINRARWALRRCRKDLPNDEPFAAIILCTSDPDKVDKRTGSKWSRVLRYAAEYKPHAEPLAAFVRRKGGINKCAARFTRCLRRRLGRTGRAAARLLDHSAGAGWRPTAWLGMSMGYRGWSLRLADH